MTCKIGYFRKIKGVGVALIYFGLVVLLYIASLAPVDRLVNGPDVAIGFPIYNGNQAWRRLYRPVDAIMDRTPLHSTLLLWSRLWGVGERHAIECEARRRGLHRMRRI